MSPLVTVLSVLAGFAALFAWLALGLVGCRMYDLLIGGIKGWDRGFTIGTCVVFGPLTVLFCLLTKARDSVISNDWLVAFVSPTAEARKRDVEQIAKLRTQASEFADLQEKAEKEGNDSEAEIFRTTAVEYLNRARTLEDSTQSWRSY